VELVIAQRRARRDVAHQKPPLESRVPSLRAALVRLRGDVPCLQEIHGQDVPGGSRALAGLDRVVTGTEYAVFHRATTLTQGETPYRFRNLVVLSRFPILDVAQAMHDFAPPPSVRP
jgi:hypothetical protein